MVIASLLALGASGGCKQGPWALWQSYSARFLDPQGRVIDPQGGDRTTSEGQAYAMFFALVANDRPAFDRLLVWTQNNLAQGDLSKHLPAWLWGKDKDGSWKTLDANSASDADVWMAYALVEAGRLWKTPAYETQGRQLLALIAKNEVDDLPGFGAMLLPGPVGFKHDRIWTLNPSYLPLFVFERFAVIDPGGPWQRIALNIPRLLEMSARHGYAMDWVNYTPGDGFYPAHGASGPNAEFTGGSYDAIRVYLWTGMHEPKGKMRARLLDAAPAMAAYLDTHAAPPEKVSDQGIPLEQEGPAGFSAALLPYLRAFPDKSAANARQVVRLSQARDKGTGLYGKDAAYYDQCLALFGTGFVDERFRFGATGELKVDWTRR